MFSRSSRKLEAGDDEAQRFLAEPDKEDDRYGRKGKPRGLVVTLLRAGGRWVKWTVTGILIVFAALLLRDSVTIRYSESDSGVISPGYHLIYYGAENRTSLPNLCRSVLTSSVLEYPPPMFFNSTRTFQYEMGYATALPAIQVDENATEYELGVEPRDNIVPIQALPLPSFRSNVIQVHHESRIDGIQQLLWELPQSGASDNDIVLVIDGYDSVFQLRGNLLLKRYHKLNKDAHARTGFKQTIVFAASKRCAPQEVEEPWCFLQTFGSASPKDVYIGQDVDKPIFLDSGFIMGPIGELLVLLGRAQEYRRGRRFDRHKSLNMQQSHRMHYGYEFGWNQQADAEEDAKLFNQIFAEQQLFREIQRSREISWWNLPSYHIASIFRTGTFGTRTPHVEHLGLLPSRTYDFHIGLDYGSSLVHVHDHWEIAHPQTRFLKHNQPLPKLTTAEADCTPRLRKLPSEVDNSEGPFYPLSNSDSGEASKTSPGAISSKRWRDVNLFTNLCTGNVPAAILYRDGVPNSVVNSDLRESHWRSLWMHNYSRLLLESQKWLADHAMAEILGGSLVVGLDVEEPTTKKHIDVLKGDVNVGDVWMIQERNMTQWQELCGNHEREIF